VRVLSPAGRTLFSIGGSFKSVKGSNWNDLVLDPMIEKLIRNDYESFFARDP